MPTKPIASGMGKPIPYKVRRKFCTKSEQLHTNDPSADCVGSSPYAGEPMGCAANLYRTIGKRQFCGFDGNFDTGLTQ